MLKTLEGWPKVMLFFTTRIQRRKTETFTKFLIGLVTFCLVLDLSTQVICISLVFPIPYRLYDLSLSVRCHQESPLPYC